jgi:hypothetical protein
LGVSVQCGVPQVKRPNGLLASGLRPVDSNLVTHMALLYHVRGHAGLLGERETAGSSAVGVAEHDA